MVLAYDVFARMQPFANTTISLFRTSLSVRRLRLIEQLDLEFEMGEAVHTKTKSQPYEFVGMVKQPMSEQETATRLACAKGC